jgi:hypothetical protein
MYFPSLTEKIDEFSLCSDQKTQEKNSVHIVFGICDLISLCEELKHSLSCYRIHVYVCGVLMAHCRNTGRLIRAQVSGVWTAVRRKI